MTDDWRGRTACSDDPQRWTKGTPDAGAIELCLACHRLRPCAEAACQDPTASGLHASVFIPVDNGAPNVAYRRRAAFTKLRGIAQGEAPPAVRRAEGEA